MDVMQRLQFILVTFILNNIFYVNKFCTLFKIVFFFKSLHFFLKFKLTAYGFKHSNYE